MKLKLWLAYLIVCVVWGSTYLVIKIGVASFPPFWFAGLRFLTASAIMMGILKWKKIPLPRGFHNYLPPLLLGFLLLFIGNGGVVWSEQYITSGLAALLAGTVPIWMALIGLLLIKSTKLSLKIILGIILGFCGMVVLIEPGIGPLHFNSLKGVFGMLLSATSWSFGSIYTTRISKRYHPLVLTTLEMFFGGVGLLIIASFTESFHPAMVTTNAWFSLGYLIVVASCLTLSAYTYLMGNAPTTWASTYAYVNPVIAVFLGWLVLQETVSWNIYIGALIIFSGIGIINWEQFRKSK